MNNKYTPRCHCQNCGADYNTHLEIILEIIKGRRIEDEVCPNCGCKDLMRD